MSVIGAGGVWRSGFYAWSSLSPSARSMADGDLTGRIKTIHQACRQICGAPRVHAELADAYNNAMCASFFATLERELLDRRKVQAKAEAHMAVFAFIEGWYNPARRHSALGYKAPITFERSHRETLETQSPSLST